MRNDFGTRPYKSRFGGSQAMKKGGSAKKKKQGYKDRKDESIAMRIRKKELRNNLELLLMNLMVSLVLKLRSLVR